MRAAITDDLLPDIRISLAAVDRLVAPADEQTLFAAITTIVTLIGQNWSAVGKKEYITTVMRQIYLEPGDIMLEALDRACRYVTNGNQLVPWLFDTTMKRANDLREEHRRLVLLDRLSYPA